MGFELLGSRMLLPFLGYSIFVWGSLISVFMLGLAADYFLGGLLADKHNRFTGMGIIIALPGLFILASPWFYQRVFNCIFELGLDPGSGPLLACLVVFTLPSVFLGAVFTYLVQLLVKQARHAGKGAGALYAMSTCGSVLGTLGTSFFLILLMGTRNCLLFMGFALLGLSLAAFAAAKIWDKKTA